MSEEGRKKKSMRALLSQLSRPCTPSNSRARPSLYPSILLSSGSSSDKCSGSGEPSRSETREKKEGERRTKRGKTRQRAKERGDADADEKQKGACRLVPRSLARSLALLASPFPSSPRIPFLRSQLLRFASRRWFPCSSGGRTGGEERLRLSARHVPS